jgi:hypothetical protein
MSKQSNREMGCWSNGVLEYWFGMPVKSDDGVVGGDTLEAVSFSTHYSSTPLLQHSIPIYAIASFIRGCQPDCNLRILDSPSGTRVS